MNDGETALIAAFIAGIFVIAATIAGILVTFIIENRRNKKSPCQSLGACYSRSRNDVHVV